MQIRTWLRSAAIVMICGAGALTLPAACSGDNNGNGDASTDATTCGAPLLQCGAACTDPKSDPNNCGACGTKCDTTKAEVCSQGTCALACGGGTSQCGASCFDLQSDQKNCGTCGNACLQGESCSAGKCGLSCSAGLSQCGDAGACVDTKSDALNCGACGNVCGPNTTCQAGACAANLLTTTPVNVSQSIASCSTNYSATGHKTAIDDTNALYVAMSCAGTVYVTRSGNGGISFVTPVATGLTGVNELAIALSSGAKPTIYVAATTTASLLFTSSSDLGATWTAPITLDPGITGGLYGVSVAVYQGTVYVQSNPTGGGQQLHVLRNGLGAGDAGLVDASDAGFALTTVQMEAGVFPNQVLVNGSNGDVWSLGENTYLLVAQSTNGGASFGQAVSPPGTTGLYTTWALAKDTLFAVNSGDPLYVIPTSNPKTDTTITGLGNGTLQQRSVAVDIAGNIYVASPTASNVRLQRVLFASTTVDGGVTDGGAIESTRDIGAIGTVSSPSVASGPKNAAFIAYTANGAVYATVQTY